jgi:putative tryptophan/tyrosine transport system substrate-binding protein
MKRREFIAATAALLVSPRRSRAQGTRRRVGYLAMDVVEPTVHKAWLDGLRNHGWIDGKNLIIEYRYAPPRIACQLSPPSWSLSAPICLSRPTHEQP